MLRQRMDSLVDVGCVGRRGGGHQVSGAVVLGEVDGDGPPPGDGRETDETGTDPNEGDETSGPFGRHPTRISERVRYGLKNKRQRKRLGIKLMEDLKLIKRILNF